MSPPDTRRRLQGHPGVVSLRHFLVNDVNTIRAGEPSDEKERVKVQ
jgi:hypothetical protein